MWRASAGTRGPLHRNELSLKPGSASIHPFELRMQPDWASSASCSAALLERGIVGGVVFPYRFRAEKPRRTCPDTKAKAPTPAA